VEKVNGVFAEERWASREALTSRAFISNAREASAVPGIGWADFSPTSAFIAVEGEGTGGAEEEAERERGFTKAWMEERRRRASEPTTIFGEVCRTKLSTVEMNFFL